jgi:uncharacterized protein YxeA
MSIILTKDQDNAVNRFLDFLVSDDNFFVIQGAAGTGKSFLIKHLLETFYSKYKSYCLLLQKDVQEFDIKITATTNKAVNVVESFMKDLLIQRDNLQVCTIFSLLGLKVQNDRHSGKSTLTFNQNNAPSFHNAGTTTLVFIDEASFIGEELDQIIRNVLTESANAKVVLIGDKYQLAPVGQTFSVMDTVDCKKVVLDEVIRNGGHILATGTQFRKTVETGIFKPIQYNNNDVIHVDGPTFQSMIDKAFADPKCTADSHKILAWTNARVQAYNKHVRKTAGRPLIFEAGETIITNNFIQGSRRYTRSVDSSVTVTRIDQQPTTHYDVKGYMVELDYMHIGFMAENPEHTKALLKTLANKKEWKKFYEIKETWLDLRDFYAGSVHKSQGSTHGTVFLDLADIGTNWNATDVARILYVSITRAAKQVVCYGYLPNRYC